MADYNELMRQVSASVIALAGLPADKAAALAGALRAACALPAGVRVQFDGEHASLAPLLETARLDAADGAGRLGRLADLIRQRRGDDAFSLEAPPPAVPDDVAAIFSGAAPAAQPAPAALFPSIGLPPFIPAFSLPDPFAPSEPFVPPEPPAAKGFPPDLVADRERAAYHRNRLRRTEASAEKRQRTKRAVDVENAGRPASQKLRGSARMQFIAKKEREWADQRDAMMAGVKADCDRKELGRVPQAVLSAAVAKFWAGITDGLEAQLRQKKEDMLRRK